MTTIDGSGAVSLLATLSNSVFRSPAGSSLTLDGLTVSAPPGSFRTAEAVFSYGHLAVIDSTFRDLHPVLGADAGAIVVRYSGEPGSLTVSGSSFLNNTTDAGNAGAVSSGVPTTITSSTFYGNQNEGNTGALRTFAFSEVTFSTFASNSGPLGVVNGPVRLVGNVFQGNTAMSSDECVGGVVDGGFNVSDETTCATAPSSLASTDAELDPAGPADNGGPTPTIALLPGSPAIDLVPAGSGLCPATDQRGVTRPVDGDDDGTAACDAGAYEAPRPPDTTNPVVTVPANITTPATGPAGATVTYTATANDDRDGPLTPTCSPASGSTFPVGTTTVTCTATDAAGNTGTGTFTVTVTPVVANKADLKITLTGPATTTPAPPSP